jgi:hypothetical protein
MPAFGKWSPLEFFLASMRFLVIAIFKIGHRPSLPRTGCNGAERPVAVQETSLSIWFFVFVHCQSFSFLDYALQLFFAAALAIANIKFRMDHCLVLKFMEFHSSQSI